MPSRRMAASSAVDISEAALNKLRDRAGRETVSNVEVIVGAVDDPHLPAGQFDAVMIHNTYYEMTEHAAMLAHIRAALKPGGRLVVVEPMHDSSRGLTREKQIAPHDIAIEIVDGELRVSGCSRATTPSSSSPLCPADSG